MTASYRERPENSSGGCQTVFERALALLLFFELLRCSATACSAIRQSSSLQLPDSIFAEFEPMEGSTAMMPLVIFWPRDFSEPRADPYALGAICFN